MKSKQLIAILVLVLLFSTSFAFLNRRSRGVRSTNVSKIQQASEPQIDNGLSEEIEDSDGSAPENSDDVETTASTEEEEHEFSLEEISGFNATHRLNCVREYMENIGTSASEFCPEFSPIARSSTDNIENEIVMIDMTYEPNLPRATETYRTLRNNLNAPLMSTADSNADLAFVSNTFDEQVSLSRVFQEIVGLTSRYHDFNEFLGIAEQDVTIDAFGCDYARRDDGDSRPYCLIYIPINAEYIIPGGRIFFDTIVIDTTDSSLRRARRVNYQGVLRLEALYDIPEEFRLTMDRSISCSVNTYNAIIDSEFDRDNPSFNLNIRPDPRQLDITNLIQNIYQLPDLQMDTPRGLSSVRYLPVLSARVHLLNRLVQHTSITTQTPNFEFLSAHIGITRTEMRVEFDGPSNYTVTVNGATSLGGMSFRNTMRKSIDQSEYNVMLSGEEGQILNFEVLNSTLLSSISVNHVNVLPTNEHAQRVLRRMNITHESLHFARPVVRLSFSPYMIYRVQGFHDTNGDRDQDCFVQGTMVNLDGEILAFYSYLFDYSRSQDLFGEAFRVQSADTAVAALNVDRFRFTTYNRDFNLSRYEELSNTEFVSSVDSNWHQGLNATVDINLIDD